MEVIRALCNTLTIQETAPDNIVAILLQTLNYLSEKVEKQEALKLKKLKSLQTLTLKVLHICHSKYEQAGQPSTQPSFWDALAALLSVYLDIVLLINRKSPGDVRVKQLCGSVAFLLAERPIYLLDVLLQTNCPSEETAELDSSVMATLCRRWLSMQNSFSDPQSYTKLIGTVKLRCSLYPTELADVILESSQVKAPKKYLQWIQEQNPSILDDIPVTPKLKLRRLTRFFLEEASNELFENILDLITASASEVEPDEPMFEIDATKKDTDESVMDCEEVGGYLIDKGAAVITDEILQDINEENLPDDEPDEDEMDSANEEEEEEETIVIDSATEEEKHEGEMKEDVMKQTICSLDSLLREARRKSCDSSAVAEENHDPEEEVVVITDDENVMDTAEESAVDDDKSNSKSPLKRSPRKTSQGSVVESFPEKETIRSPSLKKNAMKSPEKSPMVGETHSDDASTKMPPVKSPRKILTPKFDQTSSGKSAESPKKIREKTEETFYTSIKSPKKMKETTEETYFTPIKSSDSQPSPKTVESKPSSDTMPTPMRRSARKRRSVTPSSDRVPTPMRKSPRKRRSIIPNLAALNESEESSSGQENKKNSNGIFDMASESDWSPKGMGSKARNMLQHIKSSNVTPTKKRRRSLTEDPQQPQVSLRRINTRSRVDSLHQPEEGESEEYCSCDESPQKAIKKVDDSSGSRRKSMPAAKLGEVASPATPARSRRVSMDPMTPSRRSQRLKQK